MRRLVCTLVLAALSHADFTASAQETRVQDPAAQSREMVISYLSRRAAVTGSFPVLRVCDEKLINQLSGSVLEHLPEGLLHDRRVLLDPTCSSAKPIFVKGHWIPVLTIGSIRADSSGGTLEVEAETALNSQHEMASYEWRFRAGALRELRFSNWLERKKQP